MKNLFILFLCLSLSGCVSAALMGGAAIDVSQDIKISKTNAKLIKVAKGVAFDIQHESIAEKKAFLPGEKDIPAKDITTVIVNYVRTGSEAEAAGLKKGDKVIMLNGKPPSIWNDMHKTMLNDDEIPVNMTVLRDGKEYSVTIAPL